MSVVNEFTAKIVRYSHAEKTVYVIDEHDHRSTFKYTVYCKRDNPEAIRVIHFFFNLNTHQCLLMTKIDLMGSSKTICQLLRFWLENDMPVLSVRLFDGQDKVIAEIADQWNEQYGAIILDGIINQD